MFVRHFHKTREENQPLSRLALSALPVCVSSYSWVVSKHINHIIRFYFHVGCLQCCHVICHRCGHYTPQLNISVLCSTGCCTSSTPLVWALPLHSLFQFRFLDRLVDQVGLKNWAADSSSQHNTTTNSCVRVSVELQTVYLFYKALKDWTFGTKEAWLLCNMNAKMNCL